MQRQVCETAPTMPMVDKAQEYIIKMEDSQKRDYYNLLEIISQERISTVFQPIFDLHNAEVFGYEALSRVVGPSRFADPEALFSAAQAFGLIWELEELSRGKALKRARELDIKGFLTLNICPSVLKAANHRQGATLNLVQELFEAPSGVILELTERYSIKDNDLFTRTVNYYRDQGFKIAVDDLGSGFANLRMLAQIQPYIVKIDRFLISGINRSTQKMLLLEALVSFCHKINAQVVAEGIETREELELLRSMKVELGQGYFLARPGPHLAACSREALEVIRNTGAKSVFCFDNANHIGSLAQLVEAAGPDTPVASVSQLFERDENLTSVPVLENGRPVGIVHKRNLFYRLGQRYGYELFSRETVDSLAEPPTVFEAATPLEEASRHVLSRAQSAIYDDAIVVRNGVYQGMVRIHNILERITEQKVDLARQANPLTGLPGNNLIKQEIMNRLSACELFAVMYFDLDNFKPFNDTFGFDKGDQVIRLLASLIRDRLAVGDPGGFAGHVGGDDFVAVVGASQAPQLAQEMLTAFDSEIRHFHDEDTIRRGYYESLDRQGQAARFPLLSLSIAVVSTLNRAFASYGQLVSVASEVKKKAKSIPGSAYAMDQRRE